MENREQITFTEQELEYFGNGIIEMQDNFKFIDEYITYHDSEKHYNDLTIIIQRLSDGKFFKGEYEDWGNGGKEWYNTTFTEVFPEQIITTVYK